MKKITTLLTAAILLAPYCQLSSQAQNIDPEIEITQKDIAANSQAEKKPTRSYIGLGGTIGISGDSTALGEGGFSLMGRTAFNNNLSFHNAGIFQDDGLGLFALTYGVPIKNNSSQRELFFPFAGAGIAIEDFFGDFEVDPLIITGVDIPIAKKIVGTVRLGITFPEDDTDVGLLIGVGYSFGIFDWIFK